MSLGTIKEAEAQSSEYLKSFKIKELPISRKGKICTHIIKPAPHTI